MRLKLRTAILLAITVAVFVWKITWSEPPAPPPESVNIIPMGVRAAPAVRKDNPAPSTSTTPLTPKTSGSTSTPEPGTATTGKQPWVGYRPAATPTAATPGAAPADHPPTLALADAMENIGFSLRDFRAALGGNPVGTNAEITAALQGDNARQMKFPLPVGSSLNEKGELCDPWGTAWFFHQLSGTQMEVRSAGPDRVLHTADDIVR